MTAQIRIGLVTAQDVTLGNEGSDVAGERSGIELTRAHQHVRNARMHGEPGQLAAVRGDVAVRINGGQLE